MKKFIYSALATLCLIGQSVVAQNNLSILEPGSVSTAAYAQGGDGLYKEQILWLTWGALSSSDTYGRKGEEIINGTTSSARIDLGSGLFLEIRADISNLEIEIEIKNGSNYWVSRSRFLGGHQKLLRSYIPGEWVGDFLDNLYNIGGTYKDNKLVSGIAIARNASNVRFKVTAKAAIINENDNTILPIRLSGLVFADGESMDINEDAEAKARGRWTVVEVKTHEGKAPYNVQKGTTTTGEQSLNISVNQYGTATIDPEQGESDITSGIVSFLTFNEDAYDQGNGEQVTFDVRLKGGGITGIALGLLPPVIDGGDAPESYGSALHFLESYQAENDGISVGASVDVNRTSYTPGTLVLSSFSYLGTTLPDGDSGLMHSEYADQDDKTGLAGLSEEDAWPFERISFHEFKGTYSVEIPYAILQGNNRYIKGWIDINQNGKFEEGIEASEIKVAQNNGGSVTLTWEIPISRNTSGVYYVRLRMADNQEGLLSATGIALGGEVEDHYFRVAGPVRTNPMLPNKTVK